MFTRRSMQLHRFQDVADDGTDGGAGGDSGNEFDMAGALDEMSTDLFGGDHATDHGEDGTPDVETKSTEPTDTPVAPETPATPTTRTAPQSWKKEMHEKYAALPPDVQEYIEQRETQMRDGLEKDRGDANLGRTMRDVMTPYREMLQAQGVDEPRAVQYLLNAHYKLSSAPAAEKQAYFATLAQQYGIDLAGVQPGAQQTVDPVIQALRDELNGIKTHLNAGQQAALTEAKQRVSKDVESFASNPEHQYFDEVSDEIVAFLHQGLELKDAYDKAVWANPVTRAKEVARIQQDAEKTLREKTQQEVEAARKAAGNTVRNRDTRRTPTEPKGSMNDLEGSLRETLRDIKTRTH